MLFGFFSDGRIGRLDRLAAGRFRFPVWWGCFGSISRAENRRLRSGAAMLLLLDVVAVFGFALYFDFKGQEDALSKWDDFDFNPAELYLLLRHNGTALGTKLNRPFNPSHAFRQNAGSKYDKPMHSDTTASGASHRRSNIKGSIHMVFPPNWYDYKVSYAHPFGSIAAVLLTCAFLYASLAKNERISKGRYVLCGGNRIDLPGACCFVLQQRNGISSVSEYWSFYSCCQSWNMDIAADETRNNLVPCWRCCWLLHSLRRHGCRHSCHTFFSGILVYR